MMKMRWKVAWGLAHLLARAPVSLVGHAGQVSRTSLRAYHPPQALSIFTTLSDDLKA
jgi:hypothetical protein